MDTMQVQMKAADSGLAINYPAMVILQGVDGPIMDLAMVMLQGIALVIIYGLMLYE